MKNSNLKTTDKIGVFMNIKTPQQLLLFMSENIQYGFVGKDDNIKRIYKGLDSDNDFNKDFNDQYFLQSPQQLIQSGCGVCWDSTELERFWFEKNNYDFKVYLIFYNKINRNNLPTHTFLVYKEDNDFLWFEYSFDMYRGIHKYKNLKELINDVKDKHFNNSSDVITEDKIKIIAQEYNKPKYGSNHDEFMNSITKNVI